ncbi:MAG: GTPase HflX, partial [Candidatus Dadabacteria bacterium]|nr:GTPase HflX [Candidatus Dadabacteria bacterium]
EFPFDELLGRSRESKFRLRGYRIVHTHLKKPEFSQPDLVALLNERLDMIGLLEVREEGVPGKFQLAYILPSDLKDKKWEIETYNDLGQVDLYCDELIVDIESNLQRSYYEHGGERNKEGVLLVGFSTTFRSEAEESVKELKALARSANKAVLDTTVQTRKKIDPRYLIGKGKINEVILTAKHLGAEKIIFDVELSPAQVKAISDETNLEVQDRTQLILEIFAKHATTSEGKLQVRLAQLKYNLPRLVGQGVELSQLGGGIGTRGPGEMKLEEQRRTFRKQIDLLEKQITNISKRREHTRKRRYETGIPTVTFIGYTNVGKSTLFNALTKSGVVVRNKLFSTLSPTTRKIMLPSRRQILVTDTVGFISELPKELLSAFRATLEELGASLLLLHVADASDPMVEERIESVEKILESTGYESLPQQIVFNKSDKTIKHLSARLGRIYDAPVISAQDKTNLPEVLNLLDRIVDKLLEPSPRESKVELQLNTA